MGQLVTVTDLILSSLREITLIIDHMLGDEHTLSISDLNNKERLKQIRLALESHIAVVTK